jgi:hypothetical protein
VPEYGSEDLDPYQNVTDPEHWASPFQCPAVRVAVINGPVPREKQSLLYQR